MVGPALKFKMVSTAGRSCGGPSEKFVGVVGGIFRTCSKASQKLPLFGNLETQCI